MKFLCQHSARAWCVRGAALSVRTRGRLEREADAREPDGGAMDPTISLGARILEAIKDWPLWFFVAIALSLAVFVAVLEFRVLIAPGAAIALLFITITAWIFVVARAAKPLTELVLAYLLHRQQSRYFFGSPIDQQCWWCVGTRAPDAAIYGTPHSGHYIDAGQTLPVACTVLIGGVPKQKAGSMRAIIEIEDADGHRERAKVQLARR
jgi:hypothetical protein